MPLFRASHSCGQPYHAPLSLPIPGAQTERRSMMDLKIRDKTALVTGASTGIGRRIAKQLAAEGVKLAIAARRRALLEEVATEITDAGGYAPVVIEQDALA